MHLILQGIFTLYFKFLVAVLVMTSFYANGVIFSLSKNAAFGVSFGVFPLSVIAMVVVLLSLCLLIKWTVIRNFGRLQSKGLIAVDTWHAFRWGLCNGIIREACDFPLKLIDEFWLTATFWKLMGAKIGQNTLIDPNVLIYEADLLEIGDNCRIEEESTLLCHKFNDGGLKLDNIVVPSKCSLQTRCAVFPGSQINDENVTLLPLTALNPGETVSAGYWQGSPAERVSSTTGKLVPGITRRSTLLTKRSSISAVDIV